MAATKQQEAEIGVLKHIRYQGDNGFIIGVFENPKKKSRWGNEFCALGNMANPEFGLAYKMFGTWETNEQWGDQFKFQFYEVMQPNDTKGIYQYLVRVCKWVGPTVAGRIVDRYKTDTLEILKTNPADVAAKIKGLTLERAQEIQANLKENEHIEKVLVELEKIFAPIAGVRKSLPMELVKLWGSNAAAKLNENPYILTRLKGIGFPTADKVALHMGYDRKANAREKAAVLHVMNENMQSQGSVWMEYSAITEKVKELTGLSGDNGLAQLYAQKDVIGIDVIWATSEIARNESYIASKVARMV